MDRLFEIAGAGTPDILLTARDSQIGTKMTRWDCLGWLYVPRSSGSNSPSSGSNAPAKLRFSHD